MNPGIHGSRCFHHRDDVAVWHHVCDVPGRRACVLLPTLPVHSHQSVDDPWCCSLSAVNRRDTVGRPQGRSRQRLKRYIALKRMREKCPERHLLPFRITGFPWTVAGVRKWGGAVHCCPVACIYLTRLCRADHFGRVFRDMKACIGDEPISTQLLQVLSGQDLPSRERSELRDGP